MGKYIDAEKLIAEIDERLHCNGSFDEVGDSAWLYDQGLIDAYKYIKKFVVSLKREQLDVNLEEALDEYYKIVDWSPSEAIEYDTHKDIARHFYELGLNARKEE